LLRDQELGLIARPLSEKLILGAGRLDRFDHLQATGRHALQLARVLADAPAQVGAHALRKPQHHEMRRDRADADDRQPWVEIQHEHAVKRDEDHIEHDRRQAPRERAADRVVRAHSGGEVARRPREVEAHRKSQRVPHELARHVHAELHEKLQKVGSL
jgi:hypothetical protein